jgi:hypothetical protein
MISKDTPQRDLNLRKLMDSNPLEFLMKVASDKNRGRDNPVDIKKTVIEYITSTDNDMAYFAIDAAAVRMQIPEAYCKIVARFEKDNNVKVLYSMTSGIGILGRRNLIDKDKAINALGEIKQLLSAKVDNINAMKHCDEFITELAKKGKNGRY